MLRVTPFGKRSALLRPAARQPSRPIGAARVASWRGVSACRTEWRNPSRPYAIENDDPVGDSDMKAVSAFLVLTCRHGGRERRDLGPGRRIVAIGRSGSPALVLAVALVAASCSKIPSGSSPPQPPGSGPAKVASGGGNACDRRLLPAADISTIIGAPVVATRPLPGDPQTCYFVAAPADGSGPELMVTMRPAGGRAALAAYSSGRMNDYVSARPLGGVGDEAVWVPALHEVDARKGDLLCVIQPGALGPTLRRSGEAAQQQALGALCNRIFSAP
jgi:hypothetical protein